MISLVLLVIAVLCFFLAVINVPVGHVNLIAAGLLCWSAPHLAGGRKSP